MERSVLTIRYIYGVAISFGNLHLCICQAFHTRLERGIRDGLLCRIISTTGFRSLLRSGFRMLHRLMPCVRHTGNGRWHGVHRLVLERILKVPAEHFKVQIVE